MTWASIHEYEHAAARMAAGEVRSGAGDKVERVDLAATTEGLDVLTAEIEDLEQQIAVLEEGLPRAPGMQRAALAKEIAANQAELDAKRRAQRQRRGGAPSHSTAQRAALPD